MKGRSCCGAVLFPSFRLQSVLVTEYIDVERGAIVAGIHHRCRQYSQVYQFTEIKHVKNYNDIHIEPIKYI